MDIPAEVRRLMAVMSLTQIGLLAEALEAAGPFSTVRIEKSKDTPRRIVIEPSILLPVPTEAERAIMEVMDD